VAHRANSPALREANTPALEFHSVDRRGWQSHIEPMLAEMAETAGPSLRRYRAKIGRWVLEYVGDDAAASQFFARHWPVARAGETTDAYCYHFGNVAGDRSQTGQSIGTSPRCTICPEDQRAFLAGTPRYADVYEMCHEVLRNLASRDIRIHRTGRLQRPNNAWMLFRAACVEYQSIAGAARTVALLGASHAERIVQSYGLCLGKPGNASLSDDSTCIQLGTATAHRTESHFWWPTAIVANYPHLGTHFAISPSEQFQPSERVAERVRNFRDAADLARAVESGVFPEELFTTLSDELSRAADAHGMIDPHQVFAHDQCLEQSTLTDAICITHQTDDSWILRLADAEEFVSHAISTDAEIPADKSTASSTAVQQACWSHLLRELRVRPALLNALLPPAQTQFCLRHYLEGHCDSITRLTPRDFADPALLQSMRVSASHGDATTRDDQSPLSYLHGGRPVHLISFDRAGTRVEVVAFDPAEDGYAQIRTVWPGQVADFFSRHAPLRVRELFTETKNFPPPRVEALSTCR
jgi:hypothetical protein